MIQTNSNNPLTNNKNNDSKRIENNCPTYSKKSIWGSHFAGREAND